MRFSRLVGFLLITSLCYSASAASSAQVQAAIDHARAFLYSRQNHDGNWEASPAPLPTKDAYEPTGGQWGGVTALATYSLLASGERPREARLARAIEFLKNAEIHGVYALAMRAQIWSYLPSDPAVHAAIERDGQLLLRAVQTAGEAGGMYGYLSPASADDASHRYDHSVSQYGILGMWALEEAGLEVPDAYWAAVDAAWRKAQAGDGAWSYYAQPRPGYPPTITLTAAGVASLFLSDDYLRAAAALQCHDDLADADIDRGLAWINDHFDTVFDGPNRACYALYGVERIAAASGRKLFGGVDWYDKGADFLVAHQSIAGSWDQGDGEIADTAFGLLFLIRGRAPVVMNKLDYSSGANRRPRDLAHESLWMSRMLEANRPLNWQVVGIDSDPDSWHDAPILYVCGREALKFSGEQENKLKRFVEDGGLILFNADCGNSMPFVNSVRQLGQGLFNRDFRPLPLDHPIYTREEFHRDHWKNPPAALGLSNGVRELMILIPDADLSAAWQVNSSLLRPAAFELGADIFLYAVDKEHLRYRGDSYLVKPDAAVAAKTTIKLARLDYGEDWDPEPGGWRRFAAVMHNRDGVDLEVNKIKLGDGTLNTGGYTVAHLTGSDHLSLSPAARDDISRFVAAGDTLIVDAAGGSKEFAESARRELDEIFAANSSQLDKPLPINHPFYSTGDLKLRGRDIAYRPFSLTAQPDLKQPRLGGIEIGGRMGVYFSAEDLSAGLVGEPVDGIIGYTPELAGELMEKMILASRRE